MFKDKASTRYRIGDYARHMGVTPDFLKHYEQFHLLDPITQSNGYRYYPPKQNSAFLECMRLRGYGIPLRDMDALLYEEDISSVVDKLNMHIDALERQIRLKQAVAEEHRRLAAWYEQMKPLGEDWFVQQSEEMLFLPHVNRGCFIEDERIYDILSAWFAAMPVVKSCLHLPHCDAAVGTEQDYTWGLSVPARFAAQLDLPINDAVLRLPPRKVYCHHFCSASGASLAPATLRTEGMVYKKMSQLGIRPTGDIYMTLYMRNRVGENTLHHGYYAVPID